MSFQEEKQVVCTGIIPVWNNTAFAFSPDGMILAGIGGTAVAVDANHTAVDVDGLCLWDILNEKKKITL